MKVKIKPTKLAKVKILEIDCVKDSRGFFIEPWNKNDFKKAGLDLKFVQEGHSSSVKDVLRGLHFQAGDKPMEKIVRCVVGAIFDVVVDIRAESPTLGQWFGIVLSAKNKRQLYIPGGFAHGFLAISDNAEIIYKTTQYYNPSVEGSICWNDPDIGIDWPCQTPILSIRDQKAQSLQKYLEKPAFIR